MKSASRIRRVLQDKMVPLDTGFSNALSIFQKAAVRVPAYKDFLRVHHIKPTQIVSLSDFQKIPCTTKENYIDKYALVDRVWDGALTSHFQINSSSGSTGRPYYWPMDDGQISEGIRIKEFLYRTIFEIHTKPTLCIICFGMGTWIAGMYTFLTTVGIHKDGLPITSMTPGFNKEEALRILGELGSEFDQVIVAGIPTFIKDVLEAWHTLKYTRKTPRIRVLLAGEGFSESWRSYILGLARSNNPLTDSISILGSAEAAIMGFETPVSIALRKHITTNTQSRKSLFQEERIPALVQYIPIHRFFESHGGELYLTADRSVPLIRYCQHDQGGVFTFSDVQKVPFWSSIEDTLQNEGISRDRFRLPFVYVYGRGKFAATLYGVNIYSENIAAVLLQPKIRRFVTGKFHMETKYIRDNNQRLELIIECSEGVRISSRLAKTIATVLRVVIPKMNSEYKRMAQEYGNKSVPDIVLKKYGDPIEFPKDVLRKNS